MLRLGDGVVVSVLCPVVSTAAAFGLSGGLNRTHRTPLPSRREHSPPDQISLGKLNNVREALAVARECRTIVGASGITLEYSPLRHANNLESVLTYEGTSEMHLLSIGRALTGHSAFR